MVETIFAHPARPRRALAPARDRRAAIRPAGGRKGVGAGAATGAAPGGPGGAAGARLGARRRCCSCRTSRCCWCPSCRSAPGRRSRCRRPTRCGTISRWCRIRCGRARCVNSLWLATVATVAAVAIGLAGAVLGAVRRGCAARRLDRDASRASLGGAGHGVRDRARHRVQRARAVGRTGRPGGHALDPSAGLSRKEPADHQPGDSRPAFRALDPSLDEAAATLGAGRWRTLRRITLPLLRPALLAGASLAFVTALRGLRDLDHALHLRYPADLARDPVQPAAGGRRRGRGLRRRAHAGERGGLRRRVGGRSGKGTPDDATGASTGPGSAGWRCSSR